MVKQMAFKIGFSIDDSPEYEEYTPTLTTTQTYTQPRKSVVQVYFPQRGMTLAYYNDLFDLHDGDLVYVDGKLEGMCGRVTAVNYNFKIKLSDYKRVVGVVDNKVSGSFYLLGSHFVCFERDALPKNKVATWFMPPAGKDDEYASGSDDSSFELCEFFDAGFSPGVRERGGDYYEANRVKYIGIDNGKGYAIVEGSSFYEVEFTYTDGRISELTCSCFCSYRCKHEYATMLQLKDTLDWIIDKHKAELELSGCFAAVDAVSFFTYALDGKKEACITL